MKKYAKLILILGLTGNTGVTAYGVVANLAKEYSDKAPGCVWDWSDVTAGAIGALLGGAVMALTALAL